MLAIGRNPTIEALRSTHQVHRLWLEEDIKEDQKIKQIKQLAAQRQIAIETSTRKQLRKLSNDEVHQGVVAEITYHISNLNQLPTSATKLIYIREAQYEHNLGAIARTAEAAGFDGLIIPPKQQVSAVAARISMGALFHLPVFYSSLFPAIKDLRNAGFTITGMETTGGTNLFESNLTGKQLLLVGGEDKSLSQPIAERCDQLIYIPQTGKVNSLNMSVAASLVIFETTRQQR